MNGWKAPAKWIAGVGIAAVMALGAGGALAADPASCRTVRFGDVGWTDIAATTALASVTLDALGYKPTTTMSSVPLVYTGLKTKSLDVFLGNWMPTMEPFIKADVKLCQPSSVNRRRDAAMRSLMSVKLKVMTSVVAAAAVGLLFLLNA